jgi:hypothetical protein
LESVTNDIVPSVPIKEAINPGIDIEEQQQDKVLKECEEYLKDSKRLRGIAALKATGRTRSGRINPSQASKDFLRITKKQRQKDYPETQGIPIAEVNRRKEEGECLHCAWPYGRKGSHRVKDCRRPIKLDRGTAILSKEKELSTAEGND